MTEKIDKNMNTVVKTNFNFPRQKSLYAGKVRDMYDIDGRYLVMVVRRIKRITDDVTSAEKITG